MGDSSKPSSSDDDRAVKMKELQVCKVELGYVTGVDEDEEKFFIQLTKFTNKELQDLNKQINDYCAIRSQELKASQYPNSIEPKVGDVLCARYAVDGNWYRTVVKSCNVDTQKCQAYFVDYGNVIDARYEEFIQVLPSALPAIAHSPFGFYCKLKDISTIPDKKKLLYSLEDEYIMIKPKFRLDSNLWRVELPNIAYNQAFLNTFRDDGQTA